MYTINTHIKSLMALINGDKPTHLVEYTRKFVPVLCEGLLYRVEYPPAGGDSVADFNILRVKVASTGTVVEIDCRKTLAVTRPYGQLAGVEVLITLCDLLYGFLVHKAGTLKYIDVEGWYDSLCYKLILQPCPVSHIDRPIESKYDGPPRSTIWMRRFTSDPGTKQAMLARDLGTLVRFYPHAEGILAWVRHGRVMDQFYMMHKTAKMKSLVSVYRSVRVSQRRQLSVRLNALTTPLYRPKFAPKVTTQRLMDNTKWGLIVDRSLFAGNVAFSTPQTMSDRANTVMVDRNILYLSLLDHTATVEHNLNLLGGLRTTRITKGGLLE